MPDMVNINIESSYEETVLEEVKSEDLNSEEYDKKVSKDINLKH